jgi:hypothetical protein
MDSACTTCRQNGFAEPGYTGTSRRPMASKTLKVFRVVFCKEELPCTVLIPKILNLGHCVTSKTAKASCLVFSAESPTAEFFEMPYIVSYNTYQSILAHL